jgi:hypothetical protein
MGDRSKKYVCTTRRATAPARPKPASHLLTAEDPSLPAELPDTLAQITRLGARQLGPEPCVKHVPRAALAHEQVQRPAARRAFNPAS